MIQITPAITINESEIDYSFVRASGPGGQNVKIVATVNAKRQSQFRIEVSDKTC